jgi:hypothetical protein
MLDLRLTLEDRAVLELRMERDGPTSHRNDAAAHREHAVRLADSLLEVPGDVG